EAMTRQAMLAGREARLLHVATHSGGGPTGPWLRLADGDLMAREVLAEGLAPELVMLASCASATRRGLGTWGSLGAAFLASGSEHVVAALWSIDDAATARLVTRFYQHDWEEPSRALAAAQRAAIEAGEPPAAWAPFVVLGR
ncbi:MAG: CHAT domain-containing protein, partial [Acidobacteriota bacterium]